MVERGNVPWRAGWDEVGGLNSGEVTTKARRHEVDAGGRTAGGWCAWRGGHVRVLSVMGRECFGRKSLSTNRHESTRRGEPRKRADEAAARERREAQSVVRGRFGGHSDVKSRRAAYDRIRESTASSKRGRATGAPSRLRGFVVNPRAGPRSEVREKGRCAAVPTPTGAPPVRTGVREAHIDPSTRHIGSNTRRILVPMRGVLIPIRSVSVPMRDVVVLRKFH